MTITVVFGKVAGIFAMVLLGFIACRIGWLPMASSKYLSKIVINIAAPCLVIYTMARQPFDEESGRTVFLVFAITLGCILGSWVAGALFNRVLRVPAEDRGVYKNFFVFTNNGFMGLPVAFALFGTEGMFLLILSNTMTVVFMYTMGVRFLKRQHDSVYSKRETLVMNIKSLFTMPTIASVVGLGIFLLQAPVHPGLGEVLSSIGSMMTPLSMMIIGLQLTESNPRDLLLNYRLTVMSLIRLLFIPGLTFGILYLIGVDRFISAILTLAVAFPCAAAPVVLAEEYGANVKLAAEGTFLSTLLSMITLPIAGVLLTLYIL